MVTADHYRADYEATMASLDGGQRWAVQTLIDATCQASFRGDTVQRRLDAAFKREAASTNRVLAGEAQAESVNAKRIGSAEPAAKAAVLIERRRLAVPQILPLDEVEAAFQPHFIEMSAD